MIPEKFIRQFWFKLIYITRMKAHLVFWALFFVSLSILDRSYYDALCNNWSMQNFQLVQVNKISDKILESCRRSIILIETLNLVKNSRKSTLVLQTKFSIWDSFRWEQKVFVRQSRNIKNEWPQRLPTVRF